MAGIGVLNPNRPLGPPLTVRQARARDPGTEVIKKFVRRHGLPIVSTATSIPFWIDLWDEHVMPESMESYVKSLRVALVLLSMVVVYCVVFGAREFVKFLFCQSTMCGEIIGRGRCCEAEDVESREDNFSSPRHAHYNAAMETVDLGVRHGTHGAGTPARGGIAEAEDR